MIVCVQEYPNDGDQAGVYFVDVNASPAAYQNAVAKARVDRYKIGVININDSFSYGSGAISVNPPCQVQDCVTLYIET